MVATQKANPLEGLVSWLQIPNTRAELNLDSILLGAGGVLTSLGLVRLFSSTEITGDTNTGLIAGPLPFLLSGVIMAAIAGAVLFVPQLRNLRPLGISAAFSGLVLLAESASRIGDTSKPELGLLLFISGCLGLFVLPQSRHQLFLGATVFSFWRLMIEFAEEGSPTFLESSTPGVALGDDAAIISVLTAAFCLGAVWFLDRSDAAGLALPFAAVGIIAAATTARTGLHLGIAFLLFAVAAGAVWVGVQDKRRGVAWAGAAGLVLSLYRLYDGFDSRLAGLGALALGLLIVGFAARTQIMALVGLGNRGVGQVPNPFQQGNPQGPGPGQQHPQGFGGPQQQFGGPPQQGYGEPQGINPQQQFGAPPVGQQPPAQFESGGFAETAGAYSAGEPFQVNQLPQDGPTTGFDPTVQQNVNQTARQSGEVQSAGFGQSELPTQVEQTSNQTPASTGQGTGESEVEIDIREPNWYSDPTGKYDHRWHDGVSWTEHVATAGNSSTDPI